MEKKKLICESCGGLLNVDHKRNLFVCQFCGVTYDYKYFGEVDVTFRIESFLAKREYSAARDALTFLLSKEPQNAYALEKLMLLRYHLADVSDIVNKDVKYWFHVNPKEDEKIIAQAAESSKARLTTIHECISDALKISRYDLKIKNVDSEIAEVHRKLEQIDSSSIVLKNEISKGDFDSKVSRWDVFKYTFKKNYKKLIVFIVGLAAAPLIYNVAKEYNGMILALIVGFTTAAYYAFVFFIANMSTIGHDVKRIRSVESEMNLLFSELEKFEGQKKEVLAERAALKRSIKDRVNGLISQKE